MDEKTARDMDRLLAAGDLSGPEADAILERVLETVDREGRKRRPRVIRYWPIAAAGALAAAAAVLLVVRGGLPGVGPDVGPVQYEEGVPRTEIEITCADGTLAACPVTSSLVFTVSGNRERVVLSAYAERVGTGTGTEGEREREPVLYFAKEGGGVEIAAGGEGEGARVAERLVRLAPEHEPGRWRVHTIVADRVLGRDDARWQRVRDDLGPNEGVEVVIVE